MLDEEMTLIVSNIKSDIKSDIPKQQERVEQLKVSQNIQEYTIEKVLGYGGFGITYLASDSYLGGSVAIKEYFPRSLACRGEESELVTNENSNDDFQWGLEKFLLEARTLNCFSHFNIMRVRRLFKENNTAYIVMDYEEGETIDSFYFEKKHKPNEDEIKGLLIQIFDGLEEIHRRGFIHRDIKPQNIFIRKDFSPVLIDFGSSHQDLAEKKQLTPVITHGYSPIEQYNSDPSGQGPWTDIYSLGATVYKIMTGNAPPRAGDRLNAVIQRHDSIEPLDEKMYGHYSENFRQSIHRALELFSKDRYQNLTEWRQTLFGDDQSKLIDGQKVLCSQVDDSQKLFFGLGWINHNKPIDLDVSVFIVGSNGKVKDDYDFIFYNNLKSACGAVVHCGDCSGSTGEDDNEKIIIDLSKFQNTVERIIFTVTINDNGEGLTLEHLENAYIRLLDEKNNEIFNYTISSYAEIKNKRSVIIGDLYRHKNVHWVFEPKKDFFPEGLAFLATKYGVNLE